MTSTQQHTNHIHPEPRLTPIEREWQQLWQDIEAAGDRYAYVQQQLVNMYGSKSLVVAALEKASSHRHQPRERSTLTHLFLGRGEGLSDHCIKGTAFVELSEELISNDMAAGSVSGRASDTVNEPLRLTPIWGWIGRKWVLPTPCSAN